MTIAVDTNILVRYFTRDNEIEAERAKGLLDRHVIYVTSSVVLEFEWVLRSRYGLSRQRICDVIRLLLETDRILLEDPGRIGQALGAFERGLDFADALHLAGSRDVDEFATFDRALVKAAPAAFDRPAVISP